MGVQESVLGRARRIAEAVRDSLYTERADRRGRELFFVPIARFVVQVARQTIRDAVLVQAGSLSFQTLLSLVPLSLVVLCAWKLLRAEEEIETLDVSNPGVHARLGSNGDQTYYFLKGAIAELVIVKGALADGDLEKIESYMKAKYAL